MCACKCVCVCVHVCMHASVVVISLIIYLGKDDSLASTGAGITPAVVMNLVDLIKGRGHHVYMDNIYTAPRLFSDLHDNGFGACGTLLLNRRGFPAAIKETVKGEMKAFRLDTSMLAIKSVDKRVVTALTAIHDDSVVHGGETLQESCWRPRDSAEVQGHSRVQLLLTSYSRTMALATEQ